MKLNRRTLFAACAVGSMLMSIPALAQDKTEIRFSAIFSDRDIRAEMMEKFKNAVADDFKVENFFNGSLFKQGTELVAIQRGNLEMGNIAPQDFAKQVPAWSLLTSAYLFRDVDHLNKFFASDAGTEMKQMVEDQLGVKILGPTFFGTRQVGLKGNKKINTPADMAGIKLRMPGGDAWQFLGQALGANPTPMAVTEVYTGLQTGAIDGQDNPLPNVQTLKFHEVMDQIVLTSHLVGFDLLTISKAVWDKMPPEQQQKVQAAADEAIEWSAQQHTAKEAELAEFMKQNGLDVYTPDVAAFREYAQKLYLESDLAKDWPEGMLERINAL
ncbi:MULTISPECIES: sialic acid TRAP transporter substrate-binding protein SiaP [unclassified Aminobacter]|uniref:sialic acid TRAP transporter substrate-binding protein SiaP n=1 Tax=unclassified Aminobacter TaxID=2644704 RepID=UPI0004659DFA|nr:MULTISPECIES: sialic acid TRAP transporter substrate-binding protein SiaP [unclassified Aminobacter]TWH36615.1 tripartite ATP-independent transporter DctP family solute receptor [Aminobacter sp. J15]